MNIFKIFLVFIISNFFTFAKNELYMLSVLESTLNQLTRESLKYGTHKNKIFDLIEEKKLNELKKIENLDPNLKNEEGFSLLDLAIDKGNLEIVKFLIEKGADKGYAAAGEPLPLIKAVEKEHEDIAQYLIDKGADFNIKDPANQMTVLMLASYNGLSKVVDTLLEKNVDINSQDRSGATSLMLAVEKNHNQIAQKLLNNKNINIYLKDKKGKSIYDYVRNNEEIKKLVDIKVQEDEKRKEESAVKLKPELIDAVKKGDLEKTKKLVTQGVDVNVVDQDGESILMLGILGKYNQIAAYLIEKGANVNFKDKNFSTPLMAAANTGDIVLIKLLVSKGAIVDKLDKDGFSALMYAISNNNPEIVKFLADKKADVNRKTNTGTIPLLLAINKNNQEIFNILLKNGADINQRLKDGDTLLILAIKAKNIDWIRVLLKNGADINLKNKKNFSAYDFAQLDPEVFLKYLIEISSQLNKVDWQIAEQLLGLDINQSLNENVLGSRFEELEKKWNPKNNPASQSKEIFRILNNAYQLLKK